MAKVEKRVKIIIDLDEQTNIGTQNDVYYDLAVILLIFFEMVYVDNSQSFWSKLKKYFKQYSEKTSIHGLHYLTEERSLLEKIVWVVVLLLSLALCLLMIYGILTKFEHSPVVVSFSTKEIPIYEIPFPALTICPEAKCVMSQFNYTEASWQFMVGDPMTKKNFHYFHYISFLCDASPSSFPDINITTVGDDFFDIIEKVRPRGIMDCTFMGTKDEYCNSSLIPIITDRGICYSFNILDRTEIYRDHVTFYKNFHKVGTKSTNFTEEFGFTKATGVQTYPRRALSGADNSLDVILQEDPLSDLVCSRYWQGFRVIIHSPVDVPRLSKRNFLVPIGKRVVVGVHPELARTSHAVKKLKPGKRQCYLKNERPLLHFKVYTQSNCFLECLTNYTLAKCGCVAFFMPRDNETKICGGGKHKCLKDAEAEVQVQDLENRISGEGGEYCDCRPSCTEIRYSLETSHSSLPWREYFTNLYQMDLSDLDDVNFSFLSIYLEDEQFIAVQRNELYGITDLIANFGGLLGLFTGFSLVSLVELIYFLTLRIFYNRRLYGLWSGSED